MSGLDKVKEVEQVFGKAPPADDRTWDCLVIGGGAAGLTIAEYLGRFKRSVLIVDADDSRVSYIPLSHNFPSYPDGIEGHALLMKLREQAAVYGAKLVPGTAVHAKRLSEEARRAMKRVSPSSRPHFEVRVQLKGQLKGDTPDAHGGKGTGQGQGEGEGESEGKGEASTAPQQESAGMEHMPVYRARFLVLATGVEDREPELPNLKQAVHKGLIRHCPVCDAWEVQGQSIGVLGHGASGRAEAAFLRRYSRDVTLLTLGKPLMSDEELQSHGQLGQGEGEGHGQGEGQEEDDPEWLRQGCVHEMDRLGIHTVCTAVTKVSFCDEQGNVIDTGSESEEPQPQPGEGTPGTAATHASGEKGAKEEGQQAEKQRGKWQHHGPKAAVHLADGRVLQFDTLYSAMGVKARTSLACQLGIDCGTEDGRIPVSDREKMRTCAPGVYAIGDITSSLNQLAVAMGSAAIAASAINRELMEVDGDACGV